MSKLITQQINIATKKYVDQQYLHQLMSFYTTDELIDIIGIDKIQNCLRKRKMKSIKE